MKKLIRIDFDNIGDKIDYYLFNEDFEKAQAISNVIKATIKESLKYIQENFEDVNILSIGADDVLFSSTNVKMNSLKSLKDFYQEKSDLTVSIGVGNDIKEVILSLKEAKVSGKNIIKGI